jgi:hypothetical protein
VLLDSLDFSFAAQLLAFVAEEEGFGHSLAMCPMPPQKRQRLLVKRWICSAGVSFPSLPSLLPKFDVFLLELREDKLVFCGADCFLSWFDGEVCGYESLNDNLKLVLLTRVSMWKSDPNATVVYRGNTIY